MGTELDGAEPVQSGGRHRHHQRQDEGGSIADVGAARVAAAEAAEHPEVTRGDHGRDFIHFTGWTEQSSQSSDP